MMHEYEEKPDFWLIKKGDLVLIHTTVFPNEYAQKILLNGHWLLVDKVSTNQRAFKCTFDPSSTKERPPFGDSISDVRDFVFTTKHICQVKRNGIVVLSDVPPIQPKYLDLPRI